MTRASDAALVALLGLAACTPSDPVETDPADTDNPRGRDTGETDPPLDEDAWRRNAGRATVTVDADAPFAVFRDDLALEALADASRGRELFVGRWEPDGGRETLDGLGPMFLDDRCVGCHPPLGRAPSLVDTGAVDVGLLVRVGLDGGTEPDPFVGPQLQVESLEGVPIEATLAWTSEPAATWRLAGGEEVLLGRVLVTPSFPSGSPSAAARFSPRLSPQLVGIGLLDAVPEAALEALEDIDDVDGDGISGRIARLPDGPGRFGWKAIHTTARAQTAGAFSQDMGIRSPVHPDPVCTSVQVACLEAAGEGVEVSDAGLDQVAAYLAALGVPARRLPEGLDPRVGEALFAEVGCDRCHRPTLTTATEGVPAHLASVELHAYTDLLLHDMGSGLAAPVGEGDALPSEWRTPPLWGLGLSGPPRTRRFLHDGRAASLLEAIGWHGGEAATSRDAFASLEPEDRETLLDFLDAL